MLALGAERALVIRGPAGALGAEQGASAVGAPGAGAGAVAGGAEGAAGEVFPLSLEWLRQEPEEDLRRILMGIAGAAWLTAWPELEAAGAEHTDAHQSRGSVLLCRCWKAACFQATLLSRAMLGNKWGREASLWTPLPTAGLGRKSVACILLLSLGLKDFPVDTNVGRICARLGWIPLDSEQALEVRPLV